MKKVLIIVDPQNDFIEGGSLAVDGAKKAMDNLVAHINNHSSEYDKIFVSLDTHNATNLGFKENWYGDGINQVIPCKPFPVDLISTGEVYPKIPYTRKEDIETILKQPGFMCWPAHCVKGTRGHRIYPALEATLETLGSKVTYLTKGEDDARDNYSIFHYGDRGLTRHANPFKIWDRFDYPDVFIAGLATDFCVYETVKSLQTLDKNATYTLLISMCAAIQDSETVTKLYDSLEKKVTIKL